ncbi:hypothetical protein [Rufibacter quisquiliarum]|uniref:Antibiotic biosynthesis monooxygenase (ABM) superfamily enzyme n=1 Tax=Rufibacter quisquiliarum TaxID=1549639 RepID=A0A839GTQ5_9BACT|nr:hypothetical protein [Rufibacter quisquiliarum]MBA9078845.1 antibiotic biosynthesis monooxygenase (ABM) superfamily enzyme [Rufibacter quisquiliarum]
MAKVAKQHPFQRDWRRDLLIAGLSSLVLAMTVLLYTFGLTDDFLPRLFNAFIGFFLVISGTAFLVVPSVNWLFARFSKKKPRNAPAASPKRNVPKNRPKEV